MRALGNWGQQAVKPEGKAVRPSELGQDCSFQGILGLDSCVPEQGEGPGLQPLPVGPNEAKFGQLSPYPRPIMISLQKS